MDYAVLKHIKLAVFWITFFACPAFAGPYAPAAGQIGSTAIHKDDPGITGWASGYENLVYGEAVDERWRTPEKALGPAVGDSFDIVCIGRGGQITMLFDTAILNTQGPDFAVFENAFSDTFLELAYVEVSSDGQNFVRFENDSLTHEPVSGGQELDPTDIRGLAGKYRQGYGVVFDLADLREAPEVISGTLALNSVAYVRIVDVVGDGSCLDSSGDIIYDPYPTTGSAGFDLDAVAVLNDRLIGDVNLDGKITVADAVLALKIQVTIPCQTYLDADCNNDGKIDLVEAIYVLGKIPEQ